MEFIFLQVVCPLAQQIEEIIRQAELPFKLDDITVGDGEELPEEQTGELEKLHGVKEECVSVHDERKQCSNAEGVQSEV